MKRFEEIMAGFPALEELSRSGSFPIPGLEQTHVPGGVCNCMTPQGITITEKYIITSAYCNQEKYKHFLTVLKAKGDNAKKLAAEAGHQQHNSVLYVLDKHTHRLLGELTLDDATHAGGLAYDGTYLWVCKDTDRKMSAIRLTDIDAALSQGTPAVAQVHYTATCKIGGNAGFAFYYDSMLWIGDARTKEEGHLVAYRIRSNGGKLSLKKAYCIGLPKLAQGAAIVDLWGATYLAILVSGGHINPSVVRTYKLDLSSGSKKIFLDDKDCPMVRKFLLPPMGEDIAVDGTGAEATVYTLFESGSAPYRNVAAYQCASIVDRVIMAPAGLWFKA